MAKQQRDWEWATTFLEVLQLPDQQSKSGIKILAGLFNEAGNEVWKTAVERCIAEVEKVEQEEASPIGGLTATKIRRALEELLSARAG